MCVWRRWWRWVCRTGYLQISTSHSTNLSEILWPTGAEQERPIHTEPNIYTWQGDTTEWLYTLLLAWAMLSLHLLPSIYSLRQYKVTLRLQRHIWPQKRWRLPKSSPNTGLLHNCMVRSRILNRLAHSDWLTAGQRNIGRPQSTQENAPTAS